MTRSRYTIPFKGKFRYHEHRAAHHEAGHAVIGRVLGREGGLVMIEQASHGYDTGGRAMFREGGPVEAHIMTTMAGWETEREFGFDNEDNAIVEGAGHDRANIGFMCAKADQPIDVERLRRKTRRLVKKNRDKIDRVAKALLERKTLQAEEVDALMVDVG